MKQYIKVTATLAFLSVSTLCMAKTMNYGQLAQSATQGAQQLVKVDPLISLKQAKSDLLVKLVSEQQAHSSQIGSHCCQLPNGTLGQVIASHAHSVCVASPTCG